MIELPRCTLGMATGTMSIMMEGFRAAIGVPLQSPGLDSAGETVSSPEAETPGALFSPPTEQFDLSPIDNRFPNIEDEISKATSGMPADIFSFRYPLDRTKSFQYYNESNNDSSTNCSSKSDHDIPSMFSTDPCVMPLIAHTKRGCRGSPGSSRHQSTTSVAVSWKNRCRTNEPTRVSKGRVKATPSADEEEDKFLRTFHSGRRGGGHGRPYSPDRPATHTINLASSKSWRQRNEYLESLKQEIQTYECENTKLRYEIHQLQKDEGHLKEVLKKLQSDSKNTTKLLTNPRVGTSHDMMYSEKSASQEQHRYPPLPDGYTRQSSHRRLTTAPSNANLPTILDNYSLN